MQESRDVVFVVMAWRSAQIRKEASRGRMQKNLTTRIVKPGSRWGRERAHECAACFPCSAPIASSRFRGASRWCPHMTPKEQRTTTSGDVSAMLQTRSPGTRFDRRRPDRNSVADMFSAPTPAELIASDDLCQARVAAKGRFHFAQRSAQRIKLRAQLPEVSGLCELLQSMGLVTNVAGTKEIEGRLE